MAGARLPATNGLLGLKISAFEMGLVFFFSPTYRKRFRAGYALPTVLERTNQETRASSGKLCYTISNS